jgi:hypothetical protein
MIYMSVSILADLEYSRMPIPSLSRGCEIAQFFVRYMGVRVPVVLKGVRVPFRECWRAGRHLTSRYDSMTMCLSTLDSDSDD